MSPQGGVAHPVSTQADGVAFKFTNDLDMDENGTVYFTDSSTRRPRRWSSHSQDQICFSGLLNPQIPISSGKKRSMVMPSPWWLLSSLMDWWYHRLKSVWFFDAGNATCWHLNRRGQAGCLNMSLLHNKPQCLQKISITQMVLLLQRIAPSSLSRSLLKAGSSSAPSPVCSAVHWLTSKASLLFLWCQKPLDFVCCSSFCWLNCQNNILFSVRRIWMVSLWPTKVENLMQ